MTQQSDKPNSAFILAAGLGKRLRPYTDTVPKPLVPVNGRPILDYTLDKLRADGVDHVTMNLNYLGEKIQDYYADTTEPNITFSPEDELLDTGGGVKKALDTMRGDAFYLINGDALWEDGPEETTLERLTESWNPETMDILLLLQPVQAMTLTQGVGDYDIDSDGRAIRSLDQTGQYMFGGIRISKKNIFDGTAEGEAFSYLQLMDKAQTAGRLHAVVHDGEWHHISTPADLDRVNEAMKSNECLQPNKKAV